MAKIYIRKSSTAEIRKEMVNKGYKISESGKFLHRDIYERAHGKIKKGWVVHHIDCTRDNNNIENLIALPAPLHDFIHKRMRQERKIYDRKMVEHELNLYNDKFDHLFKRYILIEKEAELLYEELKKFNLKITPWFKKQSITKIKKKRSYHDSYKRFNR